VLRHPPGERGNLLLSGISRPARVLLNGQLLPEAERLPPQDAGRGAWRYSPAHHALVIWIPTDEEVIAEVHQAQATQVPALPQLVTKLHFDFDGDTEGWEAANDLAPLEVREGVLRVRSTGADPYTIRSLCRFDGDKVQRIRIRLRGTGNRGAQFYWTTLSSPGFDEAKVIRFELPLDGEWREVIIPVGEHPQWQGQTITAIRLDPGSAPDTEVEID
jgi:hypothetical protein